jgi:hypothetical protein
LSTTKNTFNGSTHLFITAFGHNKLIKLIMAFGYKELIKPITAFGYNKFIKLITALGREAGIGHLCSGIGEIPVEIFIWWILLALVQPFARQDI